LVGEELFKEAEKAYLKRLMEVYPSGVLSYVADTRNLWRVLDEIAPELKEEILARKPNALGLGKLVFRPDSGNPEDIICGTAKYYFKTMEEALGFFEEYLHEESSEACGDQCLGDDVYEEEFCVDGKFYKVKATVEYNRHDKRYYYVDKFKLHDPVEITEVECETMGCLNLLWKHFGGTTNEKGYKVLNEKVGLIYGDSITPKRAFAILTRMEAMGFASCNIVFGIGSYTYNMHSRDTLGFAMKATYCEVENIPFPMEKTPITDMAKRSAKGVLYVIEGANGPEKVQKDTFDEELEKINLLKRWTDFECDDFNEYRAFANSNLFKLKAA
jgi:nicotinamide phosphoribosyltransferase